MPQNKINPSDACPCGNALSYEQCCQALHSGLKQAASAEQLMRSRYSAYVTLDTAYLIRTWHPDHCPENLEPEASHWIGLKVIDTKLGQALDHEGWVHFTARYKVNGKAHKIEENSYFVRVDSRWVYVNGN